MSDPLLSVVVTIVDGGEALETCLDALAVQVDSPALEVIVPYDASVADMEELVHTHPECRFLDLGALETRYDPANESGRHELYDRRRAAGLDAAQGELIAMLEDRGRPRPEWARSAVGAHLSGGDEVAAVGGGVLNGIDRVLNWAAYFNDFSRYQPPLAPGRTHWLTDVNVCYRREALHGVRSEWAERFHEPNVHAALEAEGGALIMAPEMLVVEHRLNLRLGPMLLERYHWGRLFAAMRLQEAGFGPRLGLALLTPLLPLLLVMRMLRVQLRRPTLRRFCLALPVVLLLTLPKSLGEMVGYLRAR